MVWSRRGSDAPAADPAERRLVERVKRGDTEAFGELVRRYQRRAFAVAYRLLAHREDAEDLVQESFLTALERIDSFDSSRPFGPWFFRLLVNRGSHALDSRRVRATEALDAEVASAAVSPVATVERREVSDRIGRALAELPDRQRLVVQLHELDGFSTAEVAAMLDIAAATVRWTLHAARDRLRASLGGWKEERDG
jgi:RNA polymerase sigma-70 factor (ECF subfamily)